LRYQITKKSDQVKEEVEKGKEGEAVKE